jgi:Transglycosylase SLT domain/LysM domain
VDERRDVRKSTLAAVEYLRDLYTLFQSWELAAASYNAGEAKIARAIRRYGTKDFWVIAKHQFLRRETRNYVPKIIAAAIIAKNRGQFGFEDHEGYLPGEDDNSPGMSGEQLAKADLGATDLGSPDAEDEADKDSDVIDLASSDLQSDVHAEVQNDPPFVTPHVTKKGELGGEQLMDFEIQSPADLLKIARASGLSYTIVKSLNPEVLRWCTPPTLDTYRIKLPISVKERFLSTYNHEAFPREVKFLTYKVRNGETLARIARHFGIKVDPISDLNRIHPQARLIKGTQVLLPIPNDRSRTFASLEVRDPPDRRRNRSRRVRQAGRGRQQVKLGGSATKNQG